MDLCHGVGGKPRATIFELIVAANVKTDQTPNPVCTNDELPRTDVEVNVAPNNCEKKGSNDLRINLYSGSSISPGSGIKLLIAV